jgi:transposase InsO family protein
MKQHLDIYSMRSLCTALQVSRSGYYAWRARPKASSLLNHWLMKCFDAHKQKAGAPLLCKDLNAAGLCISQSSVARAMVRLKLRCQTSRKFKVTTQSKHSKPVADNLLNRQFNPNAPNLVWVGDITYIWTQEGWLYLAVMIDLFSRQVVGWQMSDRIDSALVVDALQAALLSRGGVGGLMIHTDRGVQYCSHAFRQAAADAHLIQSMSRKGNCWDNAVAESFFAGLKKHVVHGAVLSTKEQARQLVFEYIEVYYNRFRRHSNNDWQTPVEFERLYQQPQEILSV